MSNLEPLKNLFEVFSKKTRFEGELINFFERKWFVPDAPSFAYQIKDIFLEQAYAFKSDIPNPIIYDCGANIGTSVLWFKLLYPHARIKAFEADKKIYQILKNNVGKLDDVELFFNAVWINDEELSFNSEGADGGSLVNKFDTSQKVKGVRLKDLLAKEERVDFLKIDIEGVETDVIEDCKEELSVVRNLFVEYHSILGHTQTLDKLLASISSAGFRYHISTLSQQLAPFIKRNIWANMDLQLNIYAYRD